MIVAGTEELSRTSREILTPYFDEIVAVTSACDAIVQYTPNTFAIVYVDLSLRDMDGMELIAKLQSLDKYQKFIVLMEKENVA